LERENFALVNVHLQREPFQFGVRSIPIGKVGLFKKYAFNVAMNFMQNLPKLKRVAENIVVINVQKLLGLDYLLVRKIPILKKKSNAHA